MGKFEKYASFTPSSWNWPHTSSTTIFTSNSSAASRYSTTISDSTNATKTSISSQSRSTAKPALSSARSSSKTSTPCSDTSLASSTKCTTRDTSTLGTTLHYIRIKPSNIYQFLSPSFKKLYKLDISFQAYKYGRRNHKSKELRLNQLNDLEDVAITIINLFFKGQEVRQQLKQKSLDF